jgi:peptide/nickel transport system ATP-binding protein
MQSVYDEPLHPYTRLLLACLPSLERKGVFAGIPGLPPSLLNPPQGCTFHPRCPYAPPPALETEPGLDEAEPGHLVRCHLSVEERRRLWHALQEEHPVLQA